MTNYRKVLIPFCFIIVVCILMVISAKYVFYMFTSPSTDDWYKEEVDLIVVEYLKEAEAIEGKIQVYKYYYTDFDKQIAEDNRKTEKKKFPFKAIKVIAETRNQEYIVYLYVDETGILQLEKYEKRGHYNPFL